MRTLVVFHEDYRADDALAGGLDVVRAFIEAPMVEGIVALATDPSAPGVFAYATGTVRTSVRSVAATVDARPSRDSTDAGTEQASETNSAMSKETTPTRKERERGAQCSALRPNPCGHHVEFS